MKIGKKELAVRREYKLARPKQFGTLHERMKLVMHLLREANHPDFPSDLWNALYDLETEVSYHAPAKPAYGRRTLNIKDRVCVDEDSGPSPVLKSKDGLPVCVCNFAEACKVFGPIRCKTNDLIIVQHENDLGSEGFKAAKWLALNIREITGARVIILPPGFSVDHMTKREFDLMDG